MGKLPRPAETGIAPGTIFLGKYRVDELLGQGGMGVVAACTHLALNEKVAIKMLRSDVLLDRDAVERFMREAQAAVKLRSEYVARVTDVGTENDVPYMVMEFLDGHDLGELLEQRGCLPFPWATELVLQACEALAEAHSLGIVHRDVKPTNLFVTWRPDGSALIKVLDFGISKAPMGADLQLTQTQSLLGTPAYMSPEQMRSARLVDARTDIWSLGTVMYELLEGRRPFEAESFSEMCVKVAVDAPAPMVNAPPALQQVVMRCLAKSPEQRYASMAELGRDLVPFAQDPHQAQMLVDRMWRMLGRRGGTLADGWEGTSGGARSQPGLAQIRELHSGGVRTPWQIPPTPTPLPQHGAIPHAIPQREASTPVSLATTTEALRVTPRRWPLFVVLALLAGGGATAAIAMTSQRPDAPAPAASESPAPPPSSSTETMTATPPPAPPPEAVTPPVVEPASGSGDGGSGDKAAATAEAADASETTRPAASVTRPAPKRPPTRVTRPAARPKDDKPKDLEPVKPPKPTLDPFATSRPPAQKR